MRRLLKVFAALAAGLTMLLAAFWWASLPRDPGAFYRWDGKQPAKRGVLLRAEAMKGRIPASAEGWRILYSTTRPDGSIAIASALVVVPANAKGPFPVVAYAHGTIGVEPGCAPSLRADPYPGVPGFPRLIDEGWAYVATDYAGLGTAGGHFYLVGQDSGRAVLDSVIAARQIDGLQLSEKTVVWGHSQGGHSALWAGQIATAYAPDIAIAGIAAVAPATDLPKLLEAAGGSAFGKIVSAYLVAGYAAAYADLDTWGHVAGRSRLLAADIASRCIELPGALASMAETLLIPDGGFFAIPPTEGEFGARLADNVPRGPFPMPVFIAQGRQDELVLPSIQDSYVDMLCKAGEHPEYRGYTGKDHVSVVGPDSPYIADLIAWTKARFSGEAATSRCGT